MEEMLASYDGLDRVEIDILQISRNCTRQCSHCSQSPKARMEFVPPSKFRKTIDAISEFKEKSGNSLLANYLLTSTDSDPFLHPHLAKIVKALFEITGKRFYLLTSGWYLNGHDADEYQKNAEWIAEHPETIEKIALTVSNFPTNPPSNYENAQILTNAIKTFGKMPKDKFVLSPQYNAEVDKRNIHSKFQVKYLLQYAISSANCSESDFSERIFYRPIIGIGKAREILNVQHVEDYRIEAESPVPNISLRERERPDSGFVNLEGDLLITRAPRALLNRNLKSYVPFYR